MDWMPAGDASISGDQYSFTFFDTFPQVFIQSVIFAGGRAVYRIALFYTPQYSNIKFCRILHMKSEFLYSFFMRCRIDEYRNIKFYFLLDRGEIL